MHLTNDSLHHLAELVVQDRAFTPEDVKDMQHIGECEDCYQKLLQYMAVLSAIEYIAPVDKSVAEDAAKQVREDSTIIKIVVLNAQVIMEQLQTANSNWIFDVPLSGAGQRSAHEKEHPIVKLEDIEDSETFVSFDPDKKALILQIRCREHQAQPKAFLRLVSGEMQEIELEHREQLLCAEVSELPNGSFEVVLQK